jgi:HPt (histidine-containing phosphotransfer) domain-containing protein
VDNDQELLRELVQLFKEKCPRLMKSLQDAVSKEQMKTLETTGHTLKGMLASMSATRAALAASRLSDRCARGAQVDLATLSADA